MLSVSADFIAEWITIVNRLLREFPIEFKYDIWKGFSSKVVFADVSYVILSERRIHIFEFNSTTATSICSKQLWLRVVSYLVARDVIIKMRRGKSSRETINTRIALLLTGAPLGYRRGKENWTDKPRYMYISKNAYRHGAPQVFFLNGLSALPSIYKTWTSMREEEHTDVREDDEICTRRKGEFAHWHQNDEQETRRKSTWNSNINRRTFNFSHCTFE